MTVLHQTYQLNNVTPTQIRIWGTDKHPESTAILQHSGHGASYAVLLGGADINPATDSYGHRLRAGESITLSGHFQYDDVIYAMSTDPTGELHVLIAGA